MANLALETLYRTFDDTRHKNGVEFWYARDLYPLLGYTKWENFETALERAKEACRKAGSNENDHFPGVRKMIKAGKGAEIEVSDYKMTRYACYLTAINGDPRKQEVAFAQAYFVTQTRKMEVLEQKMEELERIDSREKLKITEKEFAAMAISRGVDGRGISEIKSFGDKALFGGQATDQMKTRLGISKAKPLADVLPNVTIKAKDLAMAMTNENSRQKNLSGKNMILGEHIQNNKSVRGALLESGIHPESLPPVEDIKKVESKHRKELKELQSRQKNELEQATRKLKGK